MQWIVLLQLPMNQHIPKITARALKPVDEVLQNKESYESIAVMDYAPGNQKYCSVTDIYM